jgi:hypothetical protein
MAAFHSIIDGRFWVITKVTETYGERGAACFFLRVEGYTSGWIIPSTRSLLARAFGSSAVFKVAQFRSVKLTLI